jgi:2'-hydroxyisoflavone reductase
MRILIIGGTRFLGRHIVEAALARNHEVTLFNRGKTNPDLFPQLETIIGDREHDLDKLSDRVWDTVIDVAGYLPRIVRLSAEVLEASVSRYVFISTISVYADFKKIGIDEAYTLAKMPEETTDENSPETYGARKVLCEQIVQEIYGERALIIRPGLIVGPHDPTDRFTYWPVRVARGGDVLAPQGPETATQIIDVRDLAEFTIKLIEEHAWGVYNATGLDDELTLGKLLEMSKQVSRSEANIKWASTEFLHQHKIAPWSDMPAWVPDDEEGVGFARIDVSKAIQSGLRFRPLEETIRDTLEWAQTRPANHEWKAGLTPEREAEVLAALKET